MVRQVNDLVSTDSHPSVVVLWDVLVILNTDKGTV